jgi:two-component system response regulator MprA
MGRILIIEDDPEFADYLKRGLLYEGYEAQVAANAEIGLEQASRYLPDLAILDVMLPGMDGIQACRLLRQAGYAMPILILTARNAIPDRVSGLDAGADDYLVKPFAFEELLARLRTLRRRASEPNTVLAFANLELDRNLYQAQRAGRLIPLTRTEYDLLAFLLKYPQRVFTRPALIMEVWGMEAEIHENVLDVYISRLRRKLGDPPLIHTAYGVGYILKEEN